MKTFLRILFHFLFVTRICLGQWQLDVRLTNDPGGSFTSISNAWCVASSGEYVHVVWQDERDLQGEIYYKNSLDNGTNWSSDFRLTNSTVYSHNASVAVSNINLHVVWEYVKGFFSEIYYKRSLNAGTNWDIETRLINNIAYSRSPSVSVFNSNLHVVWYDNRDGDNEIYYKHSLDNGTNWSENIRLTNNSSSSEHPSVAVSGNEIHVVWEDNRDGNQEIYYKRSLDNGANWSDDVRLTNNSENSYSPSIGVANSKVYIVWIDSRTGNDEIFFKRSLDNGTNWSEDYRLTEFTTSKMNSSIAVAGSNVHLVWREIRDNNYEIYYKHSLDNGTTWLDDVRLTNANANSWNPSIAVSNSILHVVWTDYRDGNTEIYYKRNPTGNVTGIEDTEFQIPTKFSLMQNYPNPFNSSSTIKYSIPKSSQVTLKIFNTLGEEIETLVNEEKPVGTYKVNWNAVNLPNGVYFYQLKAGDFIQTKKMILLK